MNIQPRRDLRPGEYTTVRGADTEAERADCERVLKLNGCKSVRFETTADGRLIAHGYLSAGLVFA